MTPATPDLHKLSNTPGADSAREALKETGLWDEHAAAGPEREFTVYLRATAEVEARVIVKARSRQEAEERAREKVGHEWEFRGDLHDIATETVLDGREFAP